MDGSYALCTTSQQRNTAVFTRVMMEAGTSCRIRILQGIFPSIDSGMSAMTWASGVMQDIWSSDVTASSLLQHQ